MDLGLTGKVAMVAAASKGIGFATAKLLYEEGCRLSICARSEEALAAAAAAISNDTVSYVVDVSSAEDLEWWYQQTVQDLGPVEILVTNTGGPPAGNVFDLTDDQWQQGVDSTLMNIVRLTRMVRNDMVAANWGRIVHITSLVAREPSNVLPISSTLRAGIAALARVQANELAKSGITVNCVLPGHTATDRQTHLAEIRAEKQSITVEQAIRQQEELIPAGRLATPEEIAAAIAFLCSEQAAYITGVNLLVDGGLTKGIG